MPELDEKQLKQQIKTENLLNAYLLYGSEAYLKQHYASRIAEKSVAAGMEGFNLKRYNGGECSLDEILSAAEAFPAFGGYNCIVVRDFALDSLSGDDKKHFAEFMGDLPDTTVLVFWMDTVEVNPKKNAKWKTVLAQFTKAENAGAVCLDKLDAASLSKMLSAAAQKRGSTLSPADARYLITLAGDELNVLLSEIEKLCAYRSGGEITREDIDKLTVKSLEASVFDLSGALLRKNLGRAMQILDTLLADREEPIAILAVLSGSFVDMYRVKTVLSAGERPDFAAGIFNYKNREFKLRNAARDVGKLSTEQLRQCLDLLFEADLNLKGAGAKQPRTVLETLLVSLTMIME